MLTQDPNSKTALGGLVAQDVINVFPEIVQLFPNRDGSSTYAIDYSKTGVLALKAIQELQAELEAKTATNEVLGKDQ